MARAMECLLVSGQRAGRRAASAEVSEAACHACVSSARSSSSVNESSRSELEGTSLVTPTVRREAVLCQRLVGVLVEGAELHEPARFLAVRSEERRGGKAGRYRARLY